MHPVRDLLESLQELVEKPNPMMEMPLNVYARPAYHNLLGPLPGDAGLKAKAETAAKDVVGEDEIGAIAICQDRKLKCRTAEKDGQRFVGTMEFRADRVNIFLREGRVYAALTDAQIAAPHKKHPRGARVPPR